MIKLLIMSIPSYPNFKPLEREDKELFENYYFRRKIEISDHAFTNYYIWRKIDQPQLTIIAGCLCALVMGPDKRRHFMMPLGDGDVKEAGKICLEHTGSIIRADYHFKEAVGQNEQYEIVEDRDNFDYVYLTKDIAGLKGRNYDGKRNHINAFLKNNIYVYEKMEKKHIDACIELNDIWCESKKKESEGFPNLECEAEAARETLLNKDFLGLIGGVIIVNDKILAFSLGQKLTEDTAVIHIEKSDPAVRGAAQLINREFASNELANFTYINREQDMGHPGLRRAKMSYHPVELKKKYNIRMKNDG
ncbi:MAG: phosphatidylglycerol lysyltransferase domain-containing protein [Candidatus Margulisiibacteriota bacterium]